VSNYEPKYTYFSSPSLNMVSKT